MQVLGNQQSPVKIVTHESVYVDFGSAYLKFNYSKPLPGKFGTANFTFDPPGAKDDKTPWSTTVDGRLWIIRKIHIHMTAEHLVDSDRAKPYECHLLHSGLDDPDAKGDKLVVAVFTVPNPGATEKLSLKLLNEKLGVARSSKTEPSCETVHDLNPADFLPPVDKRGGWFRYEGSLTSWPYTEDVSWIVMKDDAPVVSGHFDEIAKCAEQDERTVFPLNRRIVLRSFPMPVKKAKK